MKKFEKASQALKELKRHESLNNNSSNINNNNNYDVQIKYAYVFLHKMCHVIVVVAAVVAIVDVFIDLVALLTKLSPWHGCNWKRQIGKKLKM